MRIICVRNRVLLKQLLKFLSFDRKKKKRKKIHLNIYPNRKNEMTTLREQRVGI